MAKLPFTFPAFDAGELAVTIAKTLGRWIDDKVDKKIRLAMIRALAAFWVVAMYRIVSRLQAIEPDRAISSVDVLGELLTINCSLVLMIGQVADTEGSFADQIKELQEMQSFLQEEMGPPTQKEVS